METKLLLAKIKGLVDEKIKQVNAAFFDADSKYFTALAQIPKVVV
jgi:hypothetical protein